MTPKYPSIHAALAAAQSMAQSVEHNSRNQHMRYSYASTEAIIQEAKTALGACGLAIVPRGFRLDPPGDMIAHCTAVLSSTWAIVHEGGSEMLLESQWPVIVEGKHRPLDKATASARTASLGYLLRDTLGLARVEPGTEMDDTERDAQREEAPKEKPKRAPKPEPTPADDAARDAAKAKLRDLREVLALAKTAGSVDGAFEGWSKVHLEGLDEKAAKCAADYAGLVRARVDGKTLTDAQKRIDAFVAAL